MKRLSKAIATLLKYSLIALRPLLGPDARCKFTVTCTPFALYELENKPLIEALVSIIKRVLSCNPFTWTDK